MPPAPDAPIFTCPSCRAAVRGTRHNATFATLLEMYLAANPDKTKPDGEKAEMDAKYKSGESVLPKLNMPEKTAEQRRLDDEDRRLVQQVREMSLREAVAGPTSHGSSRPTRPRRESRSRDGRDGREGRPAREPPREPSRDGRDSGHHGGRARDARERSRRQAAEDEARRRAEAGILLSPDLPHPEEGRRQRSHSRQQSTESTEPRRRLIEHQSSIRSLISRSSNSPIDSRDIVREIEDFTRQIQEEGLLDGVDLDNIDLTNNDELSRKITEAYRRRHHERASREGGRRSNASAHSHRSTDSTAEARLHTSDSSRPTSRHSAHSVARGPEERGRYPPSSSQHLEVQEPRRRRRTTSGDRSATAPVLSSQPEPRAASRSQTDLALRTNAREHPSLGSAVRPGVRTETRSSSTPTVINNASLRLLAETSGATRLPFSARISATGLGITQAASSSAPEVVPETHERPPRPSSLVIGAAMSANFASPTGGSPSSSLNSSPMTRVERYAEPNIACRRCKKEHIEYELHYNCAACDQGRYNICLDCYRKGKGCLHWLGFGRSAWVKWEQLRSTGNDPNLPEPHLLKASRYLPPRTVPGGADGRRTMTAENPLDRLQSGAFCSRCYSWANECYWRCDMCNDGDWGFCNDCVNQGKCCTHPLLPLGYHHNANEQGLTPPASPGLRSPISPRPSTASLLASPNVQPSGPYVPLVFNSRCALCRSTIPPLHHRHHCYACVSPSKTGPDAKPGDYNICEACYAGLVREGSISADNGIDGWRRCPQGHRMVVVRFVDGPGGQRRIVTHDWIGGRMLRVEPLLTQSGPHPDLQIWSWQDGANLGEKRERVVTTDVGAAPDPSTLEAPMQARLTTQWPREGGHGSRMIARWGWYPAVGTDHTDELLFPKGAEIAEIDRFDDEWFHGIYMGEKGIFPAPYVRAIES